MEENEWYYITITPVVSHIEAWGRMEALFPEFLTVMAYLQNATNIAECPCSCCSCAHIAESWTDLRTFPYYVTF